MSSPLLKRAPDRGRPALTLLPGITLTQCRLHEACGRARRSFAMWVAAKTDGPVFWIAPPWGSDPLNPEGMLQFINPARVTFVAPHRAEDVLWTLEEVLRAGVVPFVVADLPGPPGLTAVRRCHLAAETGASHGMTRPLGLILTPGMGGAPGVETRWGMEPAHKPDEEGWHLSRLRARTDPQKDWRLGPDGAGFKIAGQERLAEMA